MFSYSDELAIQTTLRGVRDIAKVFVNNDAPARPVAARAELPTQQEFHQESVVSGVPLENYVKREPDDEETYVKVIKHEEWVEKIPQPPTPDEIALMEIEVAREKLQVKKALIATGVGLSLVGGVVGFVIFRDARRYRVVSSGAI